jgi:dipeptidyl-peptidase-4
MQSPALAGTTPTNIQVSPDGKRVTFTKGKEDDYERYDLWEYNIAEDKTQLLFDSDDLHDGEEVLSDEEKARRERMRVYGSGIMNYSWSNDGTALLFPLAGDVFYYKLGTPAAKKLVNTPEFETDVKFSPKGNYISYIREQNLYVMDIEQGKEIAITTEGGGNIKMGMAEFVAQEEMSRMTGYWWSPDEKHIAFTKVDNTDVLVITRSEIYAESIKTIEQKYPKAGTDNAVVELAVKAVGSEQASKWIELSDTKDIYLARVNWMDANTLTYQVQSRDQKTLDLMAYSLSSDSNKQLLQETSKTWINLHDDLLFLDDENFVWASERDGFHHLYLYKNDGSLVKQLTEGTWVVDSIAGVNDDATLLYFEGRKDTPLERHIYALSLTDSKITRLSDAGYYNQATFSHDGSVFVNKRSNVNTPPQVGLYKASGERLTWLAENKVEQGHPLHPYMQKWIEPSFGSIAANDDTELLYRLYTPKNTSEKRPAIVYLYSGPGVQVVANRWAGNRGLLMQHWANKGYVVFSVDNRGANYRGKAFEDPLYRAMGAVEVDDQIAGVEFLRTLDYVDSKNIGVHGHSYGGYMTLMAMFKAGDYFAAGVSGAPVTDWRLYDTHYTERYMGDPRELDDAYTAASVFPYAKDLKGDLLIYHGMADDNVLFTHSTKLYKHLQDLAIPFHTMDYPGKKHSIRGKNTGIHLYHTITNFFDTHLQN